MKHIPRQEEILEILTKIRTITVPELTARLKVSEVTIRKDLTILEEMGYVIRRDSRAVIGNLNPGYRSCRHLTHSSF